MKNFFKKKFFHVQILFRLKKTFLLIQFAFLLSASQQGFSTEPEGEVPISEDSGTFDQQGDAQAQSKLGNMYRDSQGVPQSYEEAVKWFLKAADQGHVKAQYNLGGMYAESRGVLQSDEEAVKWWLKAAKQGISQAKANLGISYYRGAGTLQDEPKGIQWLKEAVKEGFQEAKSYLDFYTARKGDQDFHQAVLKRLEFYKLADPVKEKLFLLLLLNPERSLGNVPEKQTSQVVQKQKEKAREGNPQAQFHLGLLSGHGALRGTILRHCSVLIWDMDQWFCLMCGCCLT